MNSRYFHLSKQNLIRFIGIGATATLVLKIISSSVSTTTTTIGKKSDTGHIHANNEKLVLVQMITRHGARTPLHLVPNIEEATYTPDLLETFVKAKVSLRTLGRTEVKNETSYYDEMNMKFKLKGGAPAGMLTNVGERQMFNLGRRLREKYVEELKFLPVNYDPNVIYARSSHFLRTIRSAKCVLAGLFTEPDDSDTKFIIHAHKNEDDWIFPNALNCALFMHIHSNMHKLPLLDTPDFVLQLKELNEHIGTEEGKKFLSYTGFRDDLVSRQVHNKPIPKDLLKFLEKADLLAGMELAAVFEHNIQVSCGLFLNLMLGNINKAIHKDSLKTVEEVENHRFIYYSAHDSTIAAVLVALNRNNKHKMEYHWPPFAADIQIELWKNDVEKNNSNDENYFIRVYYLGKPLVLDGCNGEYTDETKCNLNKFIKLIKLSSVTKDEFDKICNQSVKDYNLHK